MNPLIRHRHLPHWDIPGATYFITSCLAGSISSQGLLDIDRYAHELDGQALLPGLSLVDWQDRRSKLLFARRDRWLDTEPAVRHLQDARLARIVQHAILHFADVRYESLAFAVMPSHIHWVFRPLDSWVATLGVRGAKRPPRERILHSLKSFTALACNEILGAHGPFWQAESYDRCVRDEAELERIIRYVEHNPVAAGLVAEPKDWPYSSASR